MNDTRARTKKMLAAGAVLLVFGITVPATATDGTSNKPDDGTVGQAEENATPKDQSVNNPDEDSDRGFRCDGNNGAGVGNPALGACGDDTSSTHPGNGKGPGSGGNGGGGGGDNGGIGGNGGGKSDGGGSGDGEYVEPNA